MRKTAFIFWLIGLGVVYGQSDPAELDSLWQVYQTGSFNDSIRLHALELIAFSYSRADPDSCLLLSDKLVHEAVEFDQPYAQANGHYNRSVAWYHKGQLDSAIIAGGRALRKFKDLGLKKDQSVVRNRLGLIYNKYGDYPSALEQYYGALRLAEESQDTLALSNAYHNIGHIHYLSEQYAEALQGFRRSMHYDSLRSANIGISYTLNTMGMTYSAMGESDEALAHFSQALDLRIKHSREATTGYIRLNIGRIYEGQNKHDMALESYEAARSAFDLNGDELGIAEALALLGGIHIMNGSPQKAVACCLEGVAIADSQGALQPISLNRNCLYRAYKKLGESRKALDNLEHLNATMDSLKNDERTRELTRLEMRYDFQKQMFADSVQNVQERMDLEVAHATRVGEERNSRNIAVGIGIGILLFALALWSRLRFTRRAKAVIQKEKDISEGLLLNILPEEVAKELKEKGEAETQLIDHVTVLFTDFKGFTALSEQLSPKELVNDLNTCFSEFDRITAKYGIEKIKTIGDAYMAAGGLPTPNETHATDVIQAALEMRDFVEAGKAKKIAAGLPFFEVRIGIHTGPVVAGIVGVKKFQYDIWGDTVNTASRMESSGEVGQVNISEATYELVMQNPEFTFTPRGKIQAKGKGELEMYFVEVI